MAVGLVWGVAPDPSPRGAGRRSSGGFRALPFADRASAPGEMRTTTLVKRLTHMI